MSSRLFESYSQGNNELASREVVSQLFKNETAAKAADPSNFEMPIVFYQIGQRLDSWEHGHDLLSLRVLKKEVFGETLTRSDLCKIGTTLGDISPFDNVAEVPQTMKTSFF